MFTPSRAVTRVGASALRQERPKPGRDVISLAVGDPNFDTPELISDAAVTALREGWTHYGDVTGDRELRDLIAAQASMRSGETYEADQVVVTHGASAGLAASILAIVDPGDTVVLPDPTYFQYAEHIHLAGGRPVRVPLLPDFHLDLEALEPALRDARLFVYCSPGNPTGAVFTADELLRLGELIHGTKTLVLADEAYSEFVYDGKQFVSALDIAALRPNLVLCNTLSKTYAMTGWRVGHVLAPEEVAPSISLVHSSINASCNAFVQRAALAAMHAGPVLAEPMAAAYQLRRELVMNRISAIDGLELRLPEGAFYAFPRYRAEIPSRDLVRHLHHGGVTVRAGHEFGPGGERHFRISFATNINVLEEGLMRIEKALASVPTHLPGR